MNVGVGWVGALEAPEPLVDLPQLLLVGKVLLLGVGEFEILQPCNRDFRKFTLGPQNVFDCTAIPPDTVLVSHQHLTCVNETSRSC